ncbi:hypothetical protein [Mastigocoleus sp. MO_188.B34]|uniref:hypothetical protein n=1 Tax=Mastigocoleus sp. MO_188.B34 TaxID=3036635 RepID=UPI00261DCC39|nr:hypothetical protein [Mastigocoleus sp. MO_188.B34]MDJ0696189.1 hypothetical protein [Mastigocoleus sp. MO_188.B34]
MVKIKIAQNKIETVKQTIRDKGWKIDRNTTKLLSEANKYKFKQILQHKKICGSQIKITKLKFVIQDKILTSKSENDFRDYLEKEQEQEIEIDYLLDEIFFFKEIRLKYFTHRELKGFLDGEKGKGCDKDVFEVFCEVLDIPWWSLLPEDSPEYKLHNKNYILSEELKLFDHERQVNLLRIGLYEQKIFIVNNKCNCSLTWMLRRLEAEIYSFHKLKFRHFTPNKNKSRYLSSAKYHETVFHEIDIRHLKEENILIVLEIENYEQIKSMILSYWQSLIKEIPNENRGKLVMFLIADKSNVDIYDDLQTHVIELSTELKYDREGIAGLIYKIADRCKHKSLERPGEIANKLISDCQDKPLDLLKVIYQFFSIERDKNWMKLWTEYP